MRSVRTVTQIPLMDQLLRLSESEALKEHVDARNCRTLFRGLLLCAMIALGVAIALAFQMRYTDLVVPVFNLLIIRLLFLLKERELFTQHFNGFLVSFVITQSLLWRAMFFDLDPFWHPAHFAAPIFLSFFRLSPGSISVPLAAVYSVSVGRNLVDTLITGAELNYGFIIVQSALTLAVYSAVSQATSKQRSLFLVDWRRERHRRRERLRMQEELDDARKIQLSMLPRSEPDVPWLDTAGLSIPASEVGGDYYGYFTLSPTRQVIVVADVAGHGVASGILLSAVRSCLFMLHESPIEPAEVLSKIDRMLRQTSVHRSFVTLIYVLIDYETRTLTYSAAGHPPLLRLRGSDGQVEELALHTLPLGTRIGSQPRQQSVPIESQDVFIMVTDGIAESPNAGGDVYGDERLHQRLGDMTPERSAREIRDTFLGDLWSFKGDMEQLDDITLVVVKIQ